MRLTARIGVGDPDGLHSAVFRIWAQKSDVYAAVREHGHNMKVSLHGDGNCFAGLTREFAAREQDAVAAAGGRRHQSQWVRLTHLGSQMVTPLQIAIPQSELRTGRQKGGSVGEEPTWLPAPSPGASVIVSIAFTGQILADDHWPGRSNGVELVKCAKLSNGEKLWILWQHGPTSATELRMLSEASTLLGAPGMIRFSQAKSANSRESRNLIFQEFIPDRMLLVLDAAAES